MPTTSALQARPCDDTGACYNVNKPLLLRHTHTHNHQPVGGSVRDVSLGVAERTACPAVRSSGQQRPVSNFHHQFVAGRRGCHLHPAAHQFPTHIIARRSSVNKQTHSFEEGVECGGAHQHAPQPCALQPPSRCSNRLQGSALCVSEPVTSAWTHSVQPDQRVKPGGCTRILWPAVQLLSAKFRDSGVKFQATCKP